MAVYLGKNKVGMVKKFTGVDRLQWKCDNLKSLAYEFRDGTVDVNPILKGLDTSQVTNTSYMFYQYRNTNEIDLSELNFQNVTNASYMFYTATGTTGIKLGKFGSGKLTNASYMFQYCSKVKNIDVSQMDTSGITNMYSMFSTCSVLEKLNLSNFNTSNVTDMAYLFNGCQVLQNVDLKNFNTEKVTTMSNMFYNCDAMTEINLSSFNTQNLKNMDRMFYSCGALTQIDLSNFVTPNLTSFGYTFYGCPLLEVIDISNIDTSKVTYYPSTFQLCSSLKEIKGTLDIYSASNISSIFSGCPALEKFTLKNIRQNLTLVASGAIASSITQDTLINTIKELWDYTGGTSHKLTMTNGSKALITDVYVKLVDVTDEMLAQDQYAANKMPCVVCDSTDEGAITLTAYANLKNWTIA